MSRHQADLILCYKQPGTSVGKLCDKCDERCPICDSFVKQTEKVRLCDDCGFNNDRCIICNNKGAKNDAYYCFECVRLEKNRDGCPNVLTLGSTKSDRFYDQKKG